MNTKSSRSHTIFQILLESTHPDSKGMFKVFYLNKKESQTELVWLGRVLKSKQKLKHGDRPFQVTKKHQPIPDYFR